MRGRGFRIPCGTVSLVQRRPEVPCGKGSNTVRCRVAPEGVPHRPSHRRYVGGVREEVQAVPRQG